MSNLPSRSESEHFEAARRRMERWLLSDELREYMQTAKDVRDRPTRTGPYIAISRESGAGGGHVARLVGNQLDWDVLDKELLDFMTQRYSMPRERLDSIDETRSDWFHDIFGGWFDRNIVPAEDYVFHLEKIIYLAAIHGRVVLVGRGAHCLLPRDCGLSVRIVAPLEWRVARTMKRRGISEREAKQLVESLDAGRDELCKYYFQQQPANPYSVDLVINAEPFSDEAISRLIVSAFLERFPQQSVQ